MRPFLAASITGVEPSGRWLLTSAPASMSAPITSQFPLVTAMHGGGDDPLTHRRFLVRAGVDQQSDHREVAGLRGSDEGSEAIVVRWRRRGFLAQEELGDHVRLLYER